MRFHQELEEGRRWDRVGSLCSQRSREAGVLGVERARGRAAGKVKVWVSWRPLGKWDGFESRYKGER